MSAAAVQPGDRRFWATLRAVMTAALGTAAAAMVAAWTTYTSAAAWEFLLYGSAGAAAGVLAAVILARRLPELGWAKALAFAGLVALFYPLFFTALALIFFGAFWIALALLMALTHVILLFVPAVLVGRLYAHLLDEAAQ